jgi:hypothetical protein
MTIHVDDEGVIHLAGDCTIDDAEPLREQLSARPASPVQWELCERMHTAVLQVLLAAAPVVRGVPNDGFLRNHVAPLLARRNPIRET